MDGKRVAKIIDGAVIEVELLPPELRPPTLAAIGRARVKQQVRQCTRCPLHEKCESGPVPYYYDGLLGDHPPFVVVGEAPGPDEDRIGRPFVGKSGRLLRAMMNEAGLPEPAFVNVVSCYPNNGGKVRAPDKAEIEACRKNLLDQLDAIGTTFVLLTGAVAVRQWREDLTVTETRGQIYVWMRRWVVMPVMHPASLLRRPSDTSKQAMMDDLARFQEIVSGEVDALWKLGEQCIKCGGYVTHYDEEGVPWCQKHWDQFRVKVQKAQKRLGKREVVGQESMLQ